MSENHFRRFWNLGYHRLLPVVPHDCGLREAGKRPGVKGTNGWYGTSVKGYDATLEQIDAWAAMGAGVGLRCDGRYFGLDIDTLSPEWADKIVRAAHKTLGPAKRRIGRPPKTLLLYDLVGDLDYQQARFDDGVDEKRPGLIEGLTGGEGTKWFVVHGVHPVTGKPYAWPDGVPRSDELTKVTAAQVKEFFEKLREELPRHASSGSASTDRNTVDQAALKGDPDLIRAAMEATPNDSAEIGYKLWSETAVALRGACQDDPNLGLDLFCDWSEKGELAEIKEDPGRVYRSFQPPFALGAKFIFDQAQRLGGFTGHVAATWHEEIPDAPESIFQPDPPAPKRKYNFLPFAVAADGAMQDSTSPLIKGLLDQGAMTVLYGPSNVGKTFAAMDISYHIAAGVPYAGMRVTRGAVLYVAAEGGRGAKRRVRALRDKYAAQGDDVQFFLLASSVDLRRPDADLKPLISAIQELGFEFVLIVIDTLSRAMAGGDENSSVDMGFIVNHFDALRAHTRAHLLVVHHSGKNAAAGARGHSLLRAATDTEIEVSEGLIEVTKQRDLDKSWSSGFALETRVLGVDGDGDPITSCTVQLMRREEVQVGQTTPRERDVLKAVSELEAFNSDGEDGISAEEVAQYFDARADNMSISGARAMLKKLVSKNCLSKTTRGRWKTVKEGVDQVARQVAQGVFE